MPSPDELDEPLWTITGKVDRIVWAGQQAKVLAERSKGIAGWRPGRLSAVGARPLLDCPDMWHKLIVDATHHREVGVGVVGALSVLVEHRWIRGGEESIAFD